jgi:hypothetical protein
MDAPTTLQSLLFCLAAGGIAALAVVPPEGISRGFFRFTAGTYAALIVAALAARRPGEVRAYEGAIAASALLAGLYAAAPRMGRAALALSAAAGAGGLAAATLGSDGGAAALVAALLSAMLLGSAVTAMTLGHWYLVMPRLAPDPLLRLARLYAASIVLRTCAFAAALAILSIAGGRALDRFLDGAGLFLFPRVLFGILAPLALAATILPAVRARDTQPATGMLYVACVLVLVGEGIAHYLRAVTGVAV